MKLFALIENVDERDDFDIFSEGIAMLFEFKQDVTDYLMQKIIDKFESFEKYNKEYGFDWEKIFYMHDEPKLCEVETGKYYCPYDFNNKLDYKKFLDMNHEIFARIEKHNKDTNNENGPKYVIEKKKVILEKKKEEITNLEKEISEVNGINYPYMDKFKPKVKRKGEGLMGIWHECDKLKKADGIIRKYIIGKTWMGFKDSNGKIIWDVNFCPFCGVKLEDLK